MRTSNTPSSRLRNGGLGRTLIGAAAIGSTGVALKSANAEIIYSGLQNFSTSSLLAFDPTTADFELVNIDGVGGDEFTLASFGTKGTDYHWLSTGLDDVGVIRNTDNLEYPLQMQAGDPIGVDNVFGGGILSLHGFVTPPGTNSEQWEWPAGSDGYFGFRFNPTGGQDFYGWGHVTISADAKVMTLVDWAYENTGAPIQVGVPEPTSSLLLLAGLTVAAIWRRRSKPTRL